MSLTLDRIEEESRALQEALTTGASVVELDPNLIDASFIVDRFVDAADPAFDALRESVRSMARKFQFWFARIPNARGVIRRPTAIVAQSNAGTWSESQSRRALA